MNIVDYRKLRLNNLNSDEFRHLKLLLFWPVFGFLFAFVERGGVAQDFHVMYTPLDDKIPFCEHFLIPYMFWFVFLVGMIAYSLLFDVETFKRYMWYTIITYSITMLIYFVYPTSQELRPESFARDNIFTRFMASFYNFDTNTNVCPSLHVIGATAVMFAAWKSKHFSTIGWRIVFGVATLFICLSTVFLKQHSAIDIFASIPVCLLAYWVVYRKRTEKTVPVEQLEQ